MPDSMLKADDRAGFYLTISVPPEAEALLQSEISTALQKIASTTVFSSDDNTSRKAPRNAA
jgi:hypothetical protein